MKKFISLICVLSICDTFSLGGKCNSTKIFTSQARENQVLTFSNGLN